MRVLCAPHGTLENVCTYVILIDILLNTMNSVWRALVIFDADQPPRTRANDPTYIGVGLCSHHHKRFVQKMTILLLLLLFVDCVLIISPHSDFLTALQTLGIFRESGSALIIKEYKAILDAGNSLMTLLSNCKTITCCDQSNTIHSPFAFLYPYRRRNVSAATQRERPQHIGIVEVVHT